MAAADPDTRARITANMRAAERERLRNHIDPARALPPDQLETKVDQAIRERLAAAGRKGGATNAARGAALRDIEQRRDTLIADLQGYRAHINLTLDGLLEQLRTIGSPR